VSPTPGPGNNQGGGNQGGGNQGGGGPGPQPSPQPGILVVTYVANGGAGGPHTVNVASGTEHTILTLPATGISRPGYQFLGWNTAADGGGTSHAPGSTITVTGNMTFHAQWQSIELAGTTGPGGDLERVNHPTFMQGFPDGSVRPDNNITRAEAAAIFFRLLCPTDHANRNTPVPNAFSDVQASDWFAHYVNYLASVDVLLGFTDGSFRPNASISREEFATIVTRFNHPPTALVPVDPWFSDVTPDMWSRDYIYFGATRDWLRGFPDGTFRPRNPITRAEAAAVVNRVLDRAIDDAALAEINNPFNDITPAHWAFREIIEASVTHCFIRDEDGNESWMFDCDCPPGQGGQNHSRRLAVEQYLGKIRT